MSYLFIILIICCLVLEIIRLRIKCQCVTKNPHQIVKKFMFNKSVILVGNGPSLLKKTIGHKIDMFDIVVRFNGFKLFPKYTGKRTDFHIQSEYSAILNTFCEATIPILIPFQARCKYKQFLSYDRNFIHYKYIENLSRLLPKGKYPSTGLIFIYFLLKLRIPFFITGFDGTLNSTSYEASHYYKDDTKLYKACHGVNHIDERTIIEKFLKKYKFMQKLS